MKYRMLGIVICVLCAVAWGDDEYREFTNAEGQSFRGKVLSFDARKGFVQIEAENKKRAKVPLTALSEKDQAFVLAWNDAQDFLSESLFKISIKRIKEDNKDKSRESWSEEIDAENINFDILLENKSPNDLHNIKVEYCVFYEQEVGQGSSETLQQGVCYDSMDIKKFASREDRTLSTKTVIVYKEQMNSDIEWLSGRDNVQEGEVHGLWFRASMALPTGEKVLRECFLPDNLAENQTWKTSSVNVGMNK